MVNVHCNLDRVGRLVTPKQLVERYPFCSQEMYRKAPEGQDPVCVGGIQTQCRVTHLPGSPKSIKIFDSLAVKMLSRPIEKFEVFHNGHHIVMPLPLSLIWK